MHIFLSGPPHVGKSTILQKVLKQLEITPSGFVTKDGKGKGGGSVGIYIHPAGPSPSEESDSNLIGLRRVGAPLKAYPQTFETTGLKILDAAAPPLILMDELGFLENEAERFQRKVLGLLEGEIPILGVVKPRQRQTPFIEAVTLHPQSMVICVTQDTRERISEELKSLLEQALKMG